MEPAGQGSGLVRQTILTPGHVSDELGCAIKRAIVKAQGLGRWSS
jgi:hypothetical protein